MLLIPGELIALLTFPGVVFHEFAHQVGCWLSGVGVHKVCYFRLSNPSGYVLHEGVEHLHQSLLIVFAPPVLGYGAAIILAMIADSIGASIVGSVLVWLSISVSMNALSSDSDIDSLWQMLRGFVVVEYLGEHYVVEYSSPLLYRIVLFPLGGLVKLVNALRPVWIDAVISFLIIFSLVGWWD